MTSSVNCATVHRTLVRRFRYLGSTSPRRSTAPALRRRAAAVRASGASPRVAEGECEHARALQTQCHPLYHDTTNLYSGQPLTDDHVPIARRVQQVSRSARFVPVLVLSEPSTRALTGFGNRRARRRRCFARLNFSLYLSAVNETPLVPLLVSNTTRVIQDFLEP